MESIVPQLKVLSHLQRRTVIGVNGKGVCAVLGNVQRAFPNQAEVIFAWGQGDIKASVFDLTCGLGFQLTEVRQLIPIALVVAVFQVADG